MHEIRRRVRRTVVGFGLIAALTGLLAPLAGGTRVRLDRAFDPSIPFDRNVDAQILLVARLPRVLAAGLVGAGLSMAGVVFQSLLRNPLASPDTLGVSAGASLGAMLAITFQADFTVAGVSAIPLSSFAGSLGALSIVYGLASARQRGATTTVLLLAGVTVTALLSAVVRFVQYLADFTETIQTTRWLMGSLDVASYGPILAACLPLAIALALLASLPRVLDLLSVGENLAAARGVDVVAAERRALLSASLATGAAVSLAGPVAFVGIIVPHIVRIIVGADHRVVLPAAGLFGGTFLVLCDLLARTAFAPIELPVGIVTALIGGPFFLWLLLRRV